MAPYSSLVEAAATPSTTPPTRFFPPNCGIPPPANGQFWPVLASTVAITPSRFSYLTAVSCLPGEVIPVPKFSLLLICLTDLDRPSASPLPHRVPVRLFLLVLLMHRALLRLA